MPGSVLVKKFSPFFCIYTGILCVGIPSWSNKIFKIWGWQTFGAFVPGFTLQEAQLLQRDRAMLHVIEYIAIYSRSLEMAPYDRSHTSFYWCSTVTMALSCIISEIQRDTDRESWFFSYPLHLTPPLAVPVGLMQKVWWYVKPFRYDTGVWQTDGQTASRSKNRP